MLFIQTVCFYRAYCQSFCYCTERPSNTQNRRFLPILLLMTLSSLPLLLKMNVIYSLPLHLTSPAENQVFAASILTLFQGFSPRFLTSFEVWIRQLRRCLMSTLGLENRCPLLHTSEANIKKIKLNHNTVKRSQQRNNQPVIRAAFCLPEWGGEKEDLAESREAFEVAAAQLLFSLVTQLFVFEFEHPFIDNPMVITGPAVASAFLLASRGVIGKWSENVYVNNCYSSAVIPFSGFPEQWIIFYNVHNRFYSKQRPLLRSALKFVLQFLSKITPLRPVLGSELFPSNTPRMLNKDFTRFMQLLSRVRQNRATEVIP